MTLILRDTTDREVLYFEDIDEVYGWVDDNITPEERNNWELIDDEGQVFYV